MSRELSEVSVVRRSLYSRARSSLQSYLAHNEPMNPNNRSSIKVGARVAIFLKADQATGKLTEGIVQAILTNSATHPHGIKVRLQGGAVGRVKQVLD